MHIDFVLLFVDKLIEVEFVDDDKFTHLTHHAHKIDRYRRFLIINQNKLVLNRLFLKYTVEFYIDKIALLLNSTSDDYFVTEFDIEPVNSFRRSVEFIRLFQSQNQEYLVYKASTDVGYIFCDSFKIRLINNYQSPYLYCRVHLKNEII